MDEFLLVAHGVQCEIDTTPNGPTRTWKTFGNGLENIGEALNEVVQQYFFFSKKGYASNFVTGMAPAYTCTGRRIIGDPAQDYIFNPARKFGLMVERNTNFRISVGNDKGTINQIVCPVTLANVTDLGGATTDGSAVSFEVRFNGKPTLSTITPSNTLTVTSAEGTEVGETVLSVQPEQAIAGCKYVWAYGSVAPTATVGSVLTGWNDYADGNYMIPNGDIVVIAMVNTSTSVVVATGQAAVKSKTADSTVASN